MTAAAGSGAPPRAPGRLDREDPGRVEISVPSEPENWPLLRLAAANVAARLDLDVETVEDLRLAVDELCTLCAEGATERSRLTLRFAIEDDAVLVDCTVDHLREPAADDGSTALPDGSSPRDLSRMILAELVDAHTIGALENGSRHVYLEMRRRAAGS